MAKAKRAGRDASTRPITDFFSRSSPASSQPPSSPPKAPQVKGKQQVLQPRPSQQEPAVSAPVERRERSETITPSNAMPHKTATTRASRDNTRTSTPIRTYGCLKTDNLDQSIPAQQKQSDPNEVIGVNGVRKRKGSPEDAPPSASVSLRSASSSSVSSKRLRMSNSPSEDEDVVMGSQSGEEDSYPSPRNQSPSSTYTQKDSPPMTNSPSNSGYDSLFDGISGDSSLFGPSMSRDISPPPPADIDMEDPPQRLTSAEKTAQIIANIKARAYANAHSSPEVDMQPDFKDVLDSSSDEDEDELILPTKPLNKGKLKASSSSSSPTEDARPGRYNFRDRTSTASSGVASRRSPVPLTSRNPAPTRKSKSDPLENLLKEKRLANRKGRGHDAIQRAEDAVLGKAALRAEMDGEDDSEMDDDEMGERAGNMSGKSSSPLGDQSLYDPDEESGARLLGEDKAAAVHAILAQDRSIRHRSEEKLVFGVEMWTSEDESRGMEVEMSLPQWSQPQGNNPFTQAFLSAMEGGDLNQATDILNSGLIRDMSAPLAAYLLDIAFHSISEGISKAAYLSLLRLPAWGLNSPFKLTLNHIGSTLLRLGANRQYLSSRGFDVTEQSSPIDSHSRRAVLVRLFQLVSSFARAQRVDDTAEIIAALLMLSIDPSTMANLRNTLTQSIADVLEFMSESTEFDKCAESSICNRILEFLKSFDINIRHYVIELLYQGGNPRATRIARWLAFCTITKTSRIHADTYECLPPLEILVDAVKSHREGIFRTTASDVDFEEMDHHAQILGIALADISGYVVQELAEMPSTPSGKGSLTPTPASPSKKIEYQTKLQLLQTAVERIHGSIIDTRTVQLEKTRTKASLKTVSMRLIYQRNAALDRLAPKKRRRMDILNYMMKT